MKLTEDITHAITILRDGGIGVMPTDTIYGVVASAYDQSAVERLYRVRKREADKPFLVLIPSVDAIAEFGIILNSWEQRFLETIWGDDPSATRKILLKCHMCPTEDARPISVVSHNADDTFAYIHRGRQSIGFRVPRDNSVAMAVVKNVGPIVAPSANMAGETMVNDIDHIRECFGDTVDFYLPYQYMTSNEQASMIISVNDGTVNILRA
jgi:L-threonylcarbamoyladenylate synthase